MQAIFDVFRNSPLSVYDYLILVFYLVFISSMGWVFKRFNSKSSDYFAGGFKMTWWLLGASSFISNFSCWAFTGAAQIAFNYGIVIFSIFINDILSFIMAWLWFAPRFRQMRLVTAMDAIRKRFGKVNEQFYNWFTMIGSFITGAVWMVGLTIILSTAFKLPQIPVILVTGFVMLAISLMGGNWAVAASDFIQLMLFMSVAVAVGVLTVVHVGGVKAFIDQIPADHWKLFWPAGSHKYDWPFVVTGFLCTVYMRNNLGLSSKYIAAKDSRHARKSALVPLIGYMIMPIFWFIPPLAAFTICPELLSQHKNAVDAGQASYTAVCLKVLPQGMMGLMVAGMFSAALGSMDVALNKNAGFFIKNFYQPYLRKKASDKELLLAGHLATLVCGLIIVISAILLVTCGKVSLFDAYQYAAAYLGVPMGVPMILGMLVRRTPAWSAWATAVFGVLLAIFVFDIMPLPSVRSVLEPVFGQKFYAYLLSNTFVFTNIVCTPVTSLFFLATRWFYKPGRRPEYDANVADFFQKMNTPVDFEKEVGNDNTADQAKVLGVLAAIYGSFILLMVAVPNPLSGRLAILFCASFMLLVGFSLVAYSRHVRRRDAARAAGLASVPGPASGDILPGIAMARSPGKDSENV